MKVFDTVEEFETYTQPGLNSGEVYFVRESERAHFRTNNIDGVDRTYSLNSKEIIVDDELSEESENPVQNKVITLALNDKADTATTYTKTEVDGLIEDYFDGAEYDSQTTRINFKHGDTVKAYIDASDFVKDGMITDVKIENGNLVITFNTDSGKQPITIPLTDIFDPENYYTKTATDTLLSDKADKSTTYTKTEVDTALTSKANSSDVYTKTATDTLLNDKADKSTTYTKTEVDTALSAKANSSDVYNKTEVDGFVDTLENADTALGGRIDTLSGDITSEVQRAQDAEDALDTKVGTKADKSTTYTKTEVDTALNSKADKSTTYTKTEVDSALLTKANASDLTSHTSNGNIHVTLLDKNVWNNKSDFSGDYNDLTNKPTIPTVPTNVSAFNNDAGYLTSHQSLDGYATEEYVENYTYDKNTIDEKIAEGGTFDPTQYYTKSATDTLLADKADKTTTYTKTEVDTALSAKVDVSALDDIQEVIATSLNELENDKADKSTTYTKTEIDAMVGDVETLLSQI